MTKEQIIEENILVIDRGKWRTGKDGSNRSGEGITQLLNDKGYMCCLGFECLRIGYLSADIIHKGEPIEINDYNEEKLPSHLCERNWFGYTIQINDDQHIDRQERESLLEEHFAVVGIKLQFIGEYEK